MMNGIGSGGPPDPAAMFKKLDADGDQKVSKAEFEKAMAARASHGHGGHKAGGPSADDLFAKIDSDGDGSISEAENAAFMKSMEARRQQHLQKLQSGSPDEVQQVVQSLQQPTGYDQTGDTTSTVQSLISTVA